MTLRTSLSVVILFWASFSSGQLTDDYADGDFTYDPEWTGGSSFSETDPSNLWEVTGTGDTLKSIAFSSGTGSGTRKVFLSTENTLNLNRGQHTWAFRAKIDFTGLSANLWNNNHARIYLVSDSEDLNEDLNGYYLLFREEKVTLFKQTGSTVSELTLNGTLLTQSARTFVDVRVTRNRAGEWEVFTGGLSQGMVIDTEHDVSTHFGVQVRWSANSRSGHYYFDDFRVSRSLEIDSLIVHARDSISIDFNQDVTLTSAQHVANYHIQNSGNDTLSIIRAVRDSLDPSQVRLLVDPMTTESYRLTIDGVIDSSSLIPIKNLRQSFEYHQLALSAIQTRSDSTIHLFFNDTLSALSQNNADFSVDHTIGSPNDVAFDAEDSSALVLTFPNKFLDGIDYQLTLSNLENQTGNSSLDTMLTFSYVLPLIIDTVEVRSAASLLVRFNKIVNAVYSEEVANYVINQGIASPRQATLQSDSSAVLLELESVLQANDYILAVSDVRDTPGNEIDAVGNTFSFGYLPLKLDTLSQFGTDGISLGFNQPLDSASALQLANYTIESANPVSAMLSDNGTAVLLTFSDLYNGTFNLSISGVYNSVRNAVMDHLDVSISIEKATSFRALRINEVMADPSPVVALPNAEYVEVYNASKQNLNIGGFTLNGEQIPDYTLDSGKYVLIVDDAHLADFATLDNVIAQSSFDPLTNGGDQVVLKDQFGNMIDSIYYQPSWYGSDSLDDGGYSLELINPSLPCSEDNNWVASADSSGGTPGRKNAAFTDTPDTTSPRVARFEVQSPNTFLLVFDEPMEASSITTESFVLGGFAIHAVEWVNSYSYLVTLDSSLISERNYQLQMSGIRDCSGNLLEQQRLSFYHDSKAPALDDLIILSSTEITLIFHEPLLETEAEKESNYAINGVAPKKAILQDSASNRVQLTFGSEFQLDHSYSVVTSGVEDTVGNASSSQILLFTFRTDIDTVYVQAANILVVDFTKVANMTSGTSLSSFQLETGIQPVKFAFDEQDSSTLRLVFDQNFTENREIGLYVAGLFQLNGQRLITPAPSFVYDTRPPSLEELEVLSDTSLLLTWNESIEPVSASDLTLYYLEDGAVPTRVETNGQVQHLFFESAFEVERLKNLSVKGIFDMVGNGFNSTRRTSFIYDPQPPILLEAMKTSDATIRLSFHEKLMTDSAYQRKSYQLNGAHPSQVNILGPDSTEVVLTFEAMPETVAASLSFTGIYDEKENYSDSSMMLNTAHPNVTNITALSDSVLLINFSESMSSPAWELASYTGVLLDSISASSTLSAQLWLNKSLQEGEEINIRFGGLMDLHNNGLLQDSTSFQFNSFLEAYHIQAGGLIELQFETEFAAVRASHFSLDGVHPNIAVLDGEDKGLVRLFFDGEIAEGTQHELRWVELEDRYRRRLPDDGLIIINDQSPPRLMEIQSDFQGELYLVFDEALKDLGKDAANNFNIVGIGNPQAAILLEDSVVKIEYNQQVVTGISYQLVIVSLSDPSENHLLNDTNSFVYTYPILPLYGQLIFTEIMADPSPAIGLPEVEYLEIYNNSDQDFSLKGIRLSEQNEGESLGDYLLPSREHVVLTKTSEVDQLDLENVLGVEGFPTLGNAADSLMLITLNGDTIDRVFYQSFWYGDTEKDDGGYSLERISFTNSCKNQWNWSAALDNVYGTPGYQNSVSRDGADDTPPNIITSTFDFPNEISLTFDEAMDSISLLDGSYAIDGFGVDSIEFLSPDFTDIKLVFTDTLTLGQYHDLSISGLADCSGTSLIDTTITIGQGRTPLVGELLITEIMADPTPALGLPESEYIELYNASEEVLSLDRVVFVRRETQTLFPTFDLKPGNYLVVSHNADFPDSIGLLQLSDFPSLNNSGDSLQLRSLDGTRLDVVNYESSWYGDTEKDDGGYSLERINFTNSCKNQWNWSAALDNVYGTPGYQNSVSRDGADDTPPNIITSTFDFPNEMSLTFDEAMDSASLIEGSYVLDGLALDSVMFLSQEFTGIQLMFADTLVLGQYHDLSISGLADCSGTPLIDTTITIGQGRSPHEGELLITEIMADPTPALGLPESEYIELYNASEEVLSLDRVVFIRRETQTLFPAFDLKPGNYLVVSRNADFPDSIGLLQLPDFPSLNNSGDSLQLRSLDGTRLDVVNYESSWYGDTEKDDGGYSLERINFTNSCKNQWNWSAALDNVYGTPGYQNSVSRDGADDTPPNIITSTFDFPNEISLTFDEAMDSASLIEGSYVLDGLALDSVMFLSQEFTGIQLMFADTLVLGQYHDLSISGLADCSGTPLIDTTITIGQGRSPHEGELLITEIMADPTPALGLPESEYIELYNASEEVLSLDRVVFIRRETQTLFPAFDLKPGNYLVVSRNADFPDSIGLLQLPDFPSLNNSGDSLQLRSLDGTRLDVVNYESSWYGDTEKDDGGYSLERISFTNSCKNQWNWSAALDNVYGTPGYQNSVSRDGADDTPPNIITSTFDFPNEMSLTFDKSMDSASLIEGSYVLDGLALDSGMFLSQEFTGIQLMFADTLVLGQYHDLSISGLADCSGTPLIDTTITIGQGRSPHEGELLITEIMADPTPALGLPESEYIELYNASEEVLSLDRVVFVRRETQTLFPAFDLKPGNYLVVSRNADFPDSIGLLQLPDFPSLNNSGDSLQLRSLDGTRLDVVNYESSWYGDTEKDDGGYSLERISFTNSCKNQWNWSAALDNVYGTPGYQNSVSRDGADDTPPNIITSTFDFPNEMSLTFDKSMDSASLIVGSYVIDGFGVDSIEFLSPDFTDIKLVFTDTLTLGQYYDLSISGLADCSGTSLIDTTITIGQGRTPLVGELLITEIMADPTPALGLPESEYIELYNASEEVLSLDRVVFVRRETQTLFPAFDLKPGNYLVVSRNADFPDSIGLLQLSDFPSLNNSGDSLQLRSLDGTRLDVVNYQSSWYGDTEKDDGGYSLERIDPFYGCPGRFNWSASSNDLGGTPGAKNSNDGEAHLLGSPVIVSYDLLNDTVLNLHFSQPMDSLSMVQGSYVIRSNKVKSIAVKGQYFEDVEVVLAHPLTEGRIVELTVSELRACSGQLLKRTTLEFGLGKSAHFHDLLISEIMADPDPVIRDLPNAEYLEVYNNTGELVSLHGVYLADEQDTIALPAYTMLAHDYLILAPQSQVAAFSQYGKVIGLQKWLSLKNAGERVTLFDGELIHSIVYDSEWHDSEKKDGGYSLEIKDVSNPCGGRLVWGSSVHENGGTPGRQNANTESVPDNFGPELVSAIVLAPDSILFVFSEPLALGAPSHLELSIEPAIPTLGIEQHPLDRTALTVVLEKALVPNQVYTVEISDVADCNENYTNSIRTTLIRPGSHQRGDLLLSEILFNPRADGVDFVEVYNQSGRYLDLRDWSLARQVDGHLEQVKSISKQQLLVAPSGYLCLTTDGQIIQNQYPKSYMDAIHTVENLPTYPNDAGVVVLLDGKLEVMDQFAYSSSYHSSLLKSVAGVSLERVDFNVATDEVGNWSSAASAVGFATPGYANSQGFEIPSPQVQLAIEPKVFVPGGAPGMQDFTTLNYALERMGWFANVTVYDQHGRAVKKLANGASLSTSGFIKWDGANNAGQAVRMGYYLVVFELYDGAGKRKMLKETVAVGWR